MQLQIFTDEHEFEKDKSQYFYHFLSVFICVHLRLNSLNFDYFRVFRGQN